MAALTFPHLLCRYNHKLMKLAEAVLREVVDFKVEEDRFQVGLPCTCTLPHCLQLLHASCQQFLSQSSSRESLVQRSMTVQFWNTAGTRS